MNKRAVTVCTVVLVGALMGVLSKLGDVIVTGNFFTNLISGFGRVSSGFTLWICACLLISNCSSSRKSAALNVLLFLLSMLTAYYLYSKYIVDYLSLRVTLFWILMLIPAMVAGYIVHGIREKKVLKILVAVATAVLGGISVIFIDGSEPYSLAIECVLFVIIGVVLFRKSRMKKA